MKLSEIQESWNEDSKIDETNLGREAIRTPTLHSKYLTFISKAKLLHRKAQADYFNVRRMKYRYYRGELTRQELQVMGWEQYQGNKPLKNEMDEFLQCDKDLIDLQDKIEYHQTVIYTLEQILRSINSRTWDIKSGIEWNKFSNGMM